MKFIQKIYGKEILFSLNEQYSYKWFYPRYKNNGVHERKVTELIIEQCKGRKTFVDVGAHLGFFTCVVAKLFPKVHVHSFEMEKNAFFLLENNVRLNGLTNVSLHKCAVTGHNGEAFYKNTNHANEKTSVINQSENTTKVKSVTLDSLGFIPDVIKIDVEGTELDVLKGMSKILPEVKAIFLEIHPHLYDIDTMKNILEILKDFNIYEICDHRRRADPDILKVESPEFKYNNMLYAFRK